MSVIFARLLLLVFLVTSLESFANLDANEASHDDIKQIHVDITDANDEPSDANDVNDDGHCDHCFHNHTTGLLNQADHLQGLQSVAYVAEMPVQFDSNLTSPPTPPPNVQI